MDNKIAADFVPAIGRMVRSATSGGASVINTRIEIISPQL
tara:strand:- start:484 stop:603 length:120 start_codon:yes stop_codon:yes gene_type:complete